MSHALQGKKYVFQLVSEKIEEITVEAENYEEAEDLFHSGDYDNENILVVDETFGDWKCIKMPENLEEEA